MARFGDFDQYLDNAGDPLSEGKLYFYESGTTTPKTTYSDVNNSIPNTNPVLLSAAGRQPNIFFDGVAKVILTDNDDVQLIVRDPVGETATDFGDQWVATKIYNATDVVLGSDGVFYRSLINGNQGNNPVTTTGNWTLLYSVEWNAGITYQVGAVVTYDGEQYQSLQGSNLNQNPSTASSYWVLLSFAWLATATYSEDQNAVGTDGILYTSLQDSNTGNDPATSPAYWVGTSAAAAASATAAAASATAAAASETAAETAETNAETAETNAETAETNAASSATAAAGSATAAATSATNAATSATNSASSATASAASATAALASETAAAASETAAAASESAAAISETNAANSATAAATSATNSANSATASASSATDSANSASAASTSASNAATSASNAATSATASAASAAAAAASYDAFDDRYLGDKASDPTVDNDGNALLTGALYFNTTSDVMKVYDGSAWNIAAISSASPTFTGTVTADGLVIDTDTLYVDSVNNRVGIGNTSPSTALDVTGTVTANGIRLGANQGAFNPNYDVIELGNAANILGSTTSEAFILASNVINTATGNKYIISDAASRILLNNGTIDFTVASSGTAGDSVSLRSALNIANNGDISFYEDTGTTPKFFWDASAESLGIGTSSPTDLVQTSISANTAKGIRVTNTNLGTSTYASIYFGGATSETDSIIAGLGDSTTAYGGARSMVLGTNQATPVVFITQGSERLRIDSSGELTTTNGKVNLITVGRGAGAVATNTAVGLSALAANTTGDYSTALGDSALYSQTDGRFNTGLGWYTLYSNVSGTNNTASGYQSLYSNTASNNTGFGNYALRNTSTGSNNTAVGSDALRTNTTASSNTAIGYQAGYTNTVGTRVAYFGKDAGKLSTASDNTFIGQRAGELMTTGYSNTILGRFNGNQGGLDIRTSSNNIVLSDGDGNPRQIIDSSGNVYIGTTFLDPVSGNVTGTTIKAQGNIQASRSDGAVISANRKSTDGMIFEARKDGATVGIIGVGSVPSTDRCLTIGKSDSGILFDNIGNRISPWNMNTNAVLDNATDLGYSGGRFKDLYLSGGVYLGGTGAANQLDDYEEGTWTPSYTGATGGATYAVQTGSYTKVGNKVTVIAELQADRNTLSGTIKISGLPFSATGTGGGFYPTFAMRFGSDMPNLKGYITTSEINLRKQATNATASTVLTETDLSNAGTAYNYLYFTATYFTTA